MCFRPPSIGMEDLVCPECSATNPPDSTICGACGFTLPKQTLAAPGAPAIPGAPAAPRVPGPPAPGVPAPGLPAVPSVPPAPPAPGRTIPKPPTP